MKKTKAIKAAPKPKPLVLQPKDVERIKGYLEKAEQNASAPTGSFDGYRSPEMAFYFLGVIGQQVREVRKLLTTRD